MSDAGQAARDAAREFVGEWRWYTGLASGRPSPGDYEGRLEAALRKHAKETRSLSRAEATVEG